VQRRNKMTRRRVGFAYALVALAVFVLACRGPGEGESHAVSPSKAKQETEPGETLLAGSGHEPAGSPAQNGASGSPAIRFDETEFDFGEAEAGKDVEHLFSFRNVGSRTLTIEKVGST